MHAVRRTQQSQLPHQRHAHCSPAVLNNPTGQSAVVFSTSGQQRTKRAPAAADPYETTPESILAFAHDPAPKGGLSKPLDPAQILAKLTRASFSCANFQPPPPPPLSHRKPQRKRKISEIQPECSLAFGKRRDKEDLSNFTFISGRDLFKSYREASQHLFKVDLADVYEDVMLPYSVERKCALIPTEMSLNSPKDQKKDDDLSSRLWLAVTRRVAPNSRDRLTARPAVWREH